MPTYYFHGSSPTHHPQLSQLLQPGANEIPEEQCELAEQLVEAGVLSHDPTPPTPDEPEMTEAEMTESEMFDDPVDDSSEAGDSTAPGEEPSEDEESQQGGHEEPERA